MNRIEVIALGPGDRDSITLGALDKLQSAEFLVLRTIRHAAADEAKKSGKSFITLDALYDESEDFDDLNKRAADTLEACAKKHPVTYGVFDPLTDETVKELLRRKDNVHLTGGVSPADLFLCAAGVTGDYTVSPADGLHVTETQKNLVITELYSRETAGACKLELLRFYDDDASVLFFPPESMVCKEIPLYELDRQEKYDHTSAAILPAEDLESKKRHDFYDLVHVMARLRGENGCPWDLEQTHESLRQYLIEEAYETAAAIDDKDFDHMADELGDVLLQVVFQSNIGEQYGTMQLSDVTTDICKKMIERHPHIFADVRADTADDVLRNWDEIKKAQRGLKSQSDAMNDVSRGLPPLMRAYKVQQKAHKVGFDWKDAKSALCKVYEEADEVKKALGDGQGLEEEVGDLLFSSVNVARLAGIQPETALMMAVQKFVKRFTAMENAIISDGKSLEGLTLSEMDVYWERNKNH